MERQWFRSLAVVISLCACLVVPFNAVGAEGTGWTGNVNLALGLKTLEHDDWGVVDDQFAIGVDVDFRKANWPVSAAVDILYSEDSDTLFFDQKGATWEFDLGARKVFENLWVFRPFVAGGLAIINAEYKDEAFGIDGDDTGVGFWLNGGFYFTMWRHFNAGAEIRYSTADVSIAGRDMDAGGTYYGVVLGYHW